MTAAIGSFFKEVGAVVAGLGATVVYGKDDSLPELRPGKISVLLLHGSGFNQSEWVLLKGFLQKDEEVGAVYTMNYGHLFSAKDKAASIQTIATREVMPKLRAIFDRSGDPRVILVGHSLGGLVAAAVAEYYADPGNVVKVITLCSPFGGVPLLETYLVKTFLSRNAADEDMMEGSTFLIDLVPRVRRSRIYYHMAAEKDWIVPGDRALLGEDRTRQYVVLGVGHYSIVAWPSVHEQIGRWIKE